MNSRRNFLRSALALSAAAAATGKAGAAEQAEGPHAHPVEKPDGSRAGLPVPVETPDVPQLSWQAENGAKVFHLVAEPVRREIWPGKVVDLWGYNGSVPGPTIQVNQGDRVRIIVDNHLPEPTSMHWHGFEIPVEMDGMPIISQPLIQPGGRFVYEFTLKQNGTFFYHSHMAMQEMMGMIGLFIMHSRQAYRPRVDKDFGFVLQEFAVLPNATVPNTTSMEFNWLTINGKAAPATTPLIVRLGERVRLRWVNLGMDHHPIHVHGHTFVVTGSEAGRQPQAIWAPKNTVLVGVAEAADLEFVADNPGDWMVHCHLPHHMMNQMSSMTGPLWSGGHGMAAGLGMEEGLGFVRGGSATSESLGASLGRGMGVGSERERATTNLPLQHGHGHDAGLWKPAANAGQVPGYPQDHFMVLDREVEKPETHGLPANWSGGMMGMMTLLRVLPPDLYDQIQALRRGQPKQKEDKHQHQG